MRATSSVQCVCVACLMGDEWEYLQLELASATGGFRSDIKRDYWSSAQELHTARNRRLFQQWFGCRSCRLSYCDDKGTKFCRL